MRKRVEVLKKRLPKNPFYTIALQREKLPLPPNLSSEDTFVSSEGRIKRGEKNELRESWGMTKKGIKKKKRKILKRDWELRSSFGVPVVSRERFPLGPGFGFRSRGARNRSCSSFGTRTGQRVQRARLGWALQPGCEQTRQCRLP